MLLSLKVEAIGKFDREMNMAAVAQDYHVSESAVCFMKKNVGDGHRKCQGHCFIKCECS
jgi:hypothetical protein